ncbi:uncharacterized protein Z518_08666 [Rhinocladiella mackenziei CBS 650.93]|uniref:Uncharacterized protein n=1 Tax=Rhinocladiella mackenziei CBS 650.93 TaxID=1442369 RepID=A0A0D2IA12_9EURO|nr:uncharacterized protein Z518_08666 [Rhinocladiella mackenziei CBS 650.93]KIX02724.1 hypothetical protein Z518_08666 [Rhinocladiella mackenziei CBS 650.93]
MGNDVYGELRKSLCPSDPRLEKSTFCSSVPPPGTWRPWCRAKARVLALQLRLAEPFVTPVEFTDAASLAADLKEKAGSSDPDVRRIYLLEGLSDDFVSVLGNHFRLHPSLFMDHDRLLLLGNRMTGEGGGLPILPSATCQRDHVSLKYHEPLVLSERPTSFRIICDTSGRHIAVTRLMGEFSDVGICRRKCTFWSKKTGVGGWTCLIICDPPIRRILTDYDGRSGKDVLTSPFASGYLDFMPLPNQLRAKCGPPRSSLLDDLLFYLQTHSDAVDLADPSSLRIFVEKIVASHFLKLAEFLQANIDIVQFHLSRRADLTPFALSTTEELWSDVQAWMRRTAEYQDDLAGIMLQLGVPLETASGTRRRRRRRRCQDWTDSTADFRFLMRRYREIGRRVNALAGAISTLASLTGNRVTFTSADLSLREAERAGRETRSVKALTILGIVFLPLSFSASLFSMADPYLPGSSGFGVYFALSVPLVGFVILVYLVLELGYTEGERQWSFKTAIASVHKQIVRIRGRKVGPSMETA